MKKLLVIARDAIGVVGGACVAAGVGLYSAPAGLIVAGAMMIATAWLLARNA